MTAAEWLACEDPAALMASACGRVSGRKVRLVGCAVVRTVWAWCGDDAPPAVAAAERFADGEASKGSLRRARFAARDERHGLEAEGQGRDPVRWRALWLAETVATLGAFGAVAAELDRLSPGVVAVTPGERAAVCGLVRCVVGDPFRPVAVDCAWLTPTAVAVARGIYDARTFHDLPVLADALQDAGCDDADILGHCRGGGPHARGCWVVDLVLGEV